jgi:hypothetical protein
VIKHAVIDSRLPPIATIVERLAPPNRERVGDASRILELMKMVIAETNFQLLGFWTWTEHFGDISGAP